ncbi:hypothetical protein NQD34_018227 [Periophthalmus magnuspinnatus]|nr:hypothetical protein NQD34_018227 [Periophthalmus magnuspinnatus]
MKALVLALVLVSSAAAQGSKCPSGCRIQGLLEHYDHGFLKRIEKIRGLLDQNKAKHRSTDQVTKQTFDFLREKLIVSSGSDNNYLDMADFEAENPQR